MKKALIIGSTVVDVTIRVDRLPEREGDANARMQKMRLGGCACNIANMFRLLGVPYDLASPVGTGIYADFVREELQKRGMHALFTSDEENGCCYCIVDRAGDRTFLSVHGAEYQFRRGWLDGLNAEDYALGYCCGLEIEEEGGEHIIRFFEEHPELTFCYAPGVRLANIPQERTERLLALHPMLHLNLREARTLLDKDGSMQECAEALYQRTQNMVVITDGGNGSCVRYDRGYYQCPAEALEEIVDGTGAGDAHCGTFLACVLRGDDPVSALQYASQIGAAVCGMEGAMLDTL